MRIGQDRALEHVRRVGHPSGRAEPIGLDQALRHRQRERRDRSRGDRRRRHRRHRRRRRSRSNHGDGDGRRDLDHQPLARLEARDPPGDALAADEHDAVGDHHLEPLGRGVDRERRAHHLDRGEGGLDGPGARPAGGDLEPGGSALEQGHEPAAVVRQHLDPRLLGEVDRRAVVELELADRRARRGLHHRAGRDGALAPLGHQRPRRCHVRRAEQRDGEDRRRQRRPHGEQRAHPAAAPPGPAALDQPVPGLGEAGLVHRRRQSELVAGRDHGPSEGRAAAPALGMPRWAWTAASAWATRRFTVASEQSLAVAT